MKNKGNEIIKSRQSDLISQLKNKRKQLGYTQRETAEKAGIPQSALARLESGSLSPRLDTLINLELVLGLKMTFIADGYSDVRKR